MLDRSLLVPSVNELILLAYRRRGTHCLLSLLRLLVVCIAFCFSLHAGVYLMSPMLHSLTRNISEDSVIAMIVGLCVTHLFLHDYK